MHRFSGLFGSGFSFLLLCQQTQYSSDTFCFFLKYLHLPFCQNPFGSYVSTHVTGSYHILWKLVVLCSRHVTVSPVQQKLLLMAISQPPNLVKGKHLLKTCNLGTISSGKIVISSSFSVHLKCFFLWDTSEVRIPILTFPHQAKLSPCSLLSDSSCSDHN